MRADNEITADDIGQVMDSARGIMLPNDKEIIHTIPHEFTVNGQKDIEDPIGLQCSHLAVDVHIVTGTVSCINNLQKCVSQAGFDFKEIVSSVLAAGEVIVSPDERKIGCVLVDMGAQTTDVVIYSDRTSRQIGEIGLGGDDITGDISHELRASPASAKELKEKFGSAAISLIDPKEEITYNYIDGRTQKTITRKHLYGIIRPRVEEILAFVADEIDKSPFKEMLSSGIVLTGGASQLLGMSEACEEILQLPTIMGIPRYVKGSVEGITNPSFACAIGLVKLYFSDMEMSSRHVSRKSRLFGKLKRLFEDAM